ncbi:FAD-binding oxidoreductase [Streptomyces sp. URMC 123]|uniref:FAD-binding oxidoreductase n=1 Tax=Streptomyces sp. URMC 123 TaxID=3423403 RepID=UPI003F1B13D4
MTDYSRRRFLMRTAMSGSAAAALAVTGGAGGAGGTAAAATPPPTSPVIPPVAPTVTAPAIPSATVTVTPADRRYPDLVWGTNRRWVGTPDRVHLVSSADEVVAAVQEAVDTGRGLAVRSGGHCYEDFVTHDGVRVVIDVSGMDRIAYDPARRAFAVEPGARLGPLYSTLYKRWGVTVPAGTCPSVGVGGHVVGGGYGALSRLHGLVVDHLYGVELVVVDRRGTARKVVATREPDDPNRELWWAHTGAGGGNFGVITKYWLRSPGATGGDPAGLLPRPPAELLISTVTWPWEGMTEASFTRLLGNYGRWCERNSGPDSPYASLFSQLKPTHRSAGAFSMTTQLDAGAPGADRLLDDFLAAVGEGVRVPYRVDDRRTLPWLHATTHWPGFTAPDTSTRFKAKSAYMRRGFPRAQLTAFHRHLTRSDFTGPASLVMISAYGGRINTVAPGATAVPQRDSVLKLHYISFWQHAADDARHLAWMREFYEDVYAATGGVPVPGDAVTDGCFVNYADADLNSPRFNRSGVPWHELYYKDGYRRLQAVKARWDPRNVFRHGQSIALPTSS